MDYTIVKVEKKTNNNKNGMMERMQLVFRTIYRKRSSFFQQKIVLNCQAP